MPIQVSKERSDTYIGTFEYSNAEDMKQLEMLKGMVSSINKMLKADGLDYQFYVKLAGRLGKGNPKASLYKENHYDHTKPYQNIRLTDAQSVDAYIYRRN